MYRVVLIDDEAVILEGLKRVVKWENYDCQVVGTAFDAKSGNDLIRQEKPDILFTDIRMPGQRGLTMLAGLRSEFPDMQVTVMTGYRDFSYAQEAIRIENAKRLLENPGLKIGQIGEMVGYADAAHFTRTFKKLEGINANEYRNRMRNS